MIQLLDVKLNKNRKLLFELSKVYGLGTGEVFKILSKYGLSKNILVCQVPNYKIIRLVRYIKLYNTVGIDLRNVLREKILLERRIKTYKAYRRYYKLPLNGQRTKTNAKTVKKLL